VIQEAVRVTELLRPSATELRWATAVEMRQVRGEELVRKN
jgi:hypothetical protein